MHEILKGMKGGVACYDAKSGQTVWHRTDLRHTQSVRFSPAGDSVWCGAAEGPLKHLSARTGETLDALAGFADIRESAIPGQMLWVTRGRGFRVTADADFRIPPLTFAVLDAAFNADAVCIAEACGAVRCFTISAKRERWRYDPPPGHHVVTLWCREADQPFYGILIGYQVRVPNLLLRFEAETGRCHEISQLKHREGESYSAGDGFLTTGGEVVDVATGAVVAVLDFPQREYPDH